MVYQNHMLLEGQRQFPHLPLTVPCRVHIQNPSEFPTGNGKLSGGVTERNELLLAPVVVDDDVHGEGPQWNVGRVDGQG